MTTLTTAQTNLLNDIVLKNERRAIFEVTSLLNKQEKEVSRLEKALKKLNSNKEVK